jgi:hypothetical protein
MKGNLMNRIFEAIGEYMGEREVILSFLLTGILLVLSFVAHTRFATTQVMVEGKNYMVHASYYGYPFEMLGVLSPITEDESYWVYLSGEGSFRVLLSGLCINFVLCFSLAFFIVYLSRRLKRMMTGSQV